MFCILLDGETRTVEQRQSIERESQGKLRFLDRRMIENYLLDADAISAVLCELGETTSPSDTAHQLALTLGCTEHSDDPAKLDGASVLSAVFSTLSDARQEFRKTRDVPALAEHLIEHKADSLAPLKICLRRVCDLA